jgi:hypothetical protein
MKGDKSDFAPKDELREFKVNGSDFKFEYEPLSVGEKADMQPLYMERNKDGNKYTNFTNLGTCMATKIKKVPWNKKILKEMTGIDKTWESMDAKERFDTLRSLDENVFTNIIMEVFRKEGLIKKIQEDKKKDSKK